MVSPPLVRFLDATRFLGFRNMLWIVPCWLVRPRYHVMTRDLRRPLPEVPPGEPLHWKELTEADLAQILAINPAMSEAEIRRRWDEGQECQLGWIEGALVYHGWHARRPVYLPYLGRTLRLLEGDYLLSDTFTHPAFRTRGIQLRTSIWSLHRARDQGCTRHLAINAWWNAPSLRVAQNTGFRRVGTVGYWTVGLRRFAFATGDVCLEGDDSLYVRR